MNLLSVFFKSIAILFFALFLSIDCAFSQSNKTISVTNKLEMDRKSETVSIPLKSIELIVKDFGIENVLIKDGVKIVVSQTIDNNMDGTMDEIIFQTDIKANETKKFQVVGEKDGISKQPKSKLTTYSRFVPERTDDYAWENDRVAFRTYGPVAQQLFEAKDKKGTLSSGIDCWLKRVDYSIIDKWYKLALEGKSYHKDWGEGHDPYHVGVSRGCGGIGVWDNDMLYFSKNFVEYKTIAVGPIRTIFELTYAPWDANGREIKETKRISLDLGSNMSRFEIDLKSNATIPNCAIGITLHDKKGEIKANEKNGWYRHWEKSDSVSFIGEGIVIDPSSVSEYKDYRVAKLDNSNLLVITKPVTKPVVYYAGFAWTKSGQVTNSSEWDAYLEDFSKRLASPLMVVVK